MTVVRPLRYESNNAKDGPLGLPVGTLVRKSFENQELVPVNGLNFVINSLTEQIPATTPELLSDAAEWVAGAIDFTGVNKIVGEEDKGGILVAATALRVSLPFGLARWQPSGLKGQIVVPFECEYTTGNLFLNGVEAGDKVVIVDDIISTGGTLVSLIKAIRSAGAVITDTVCVAEKIEYGGVERVLKETGVKVKTLLQLDLSGTHAKVV